MPYVLQQRVSRAWNPNFAYAIGLIASDGYLNNDGKKLWLSSKDLELVQHLRLALGISNNIGRYARGGETEKKYFYISFGDKLFHEYLGSIGITPTKSRTIKKVEVPRWLFSHFLRGIFDGDGTFYTFRDYRWPNALGYQISFASASRSFLPWLKETLTAHYGVKGFICRGAGVYNLRYVKRDSIRIAKAMYGDSLAPTGLLLLRRKYDTIIGVFEKDKLFRKLNMPR